MVDASSSPLLVPLFLGRACVRRARLAIKRDRLATDSSRGASHEKYYKILDRMNGRKVILHAHVHSAQCISFSRAAADHPRGGRVAPLCLLSRHLLSLSLVSLMAYREVTRRDAGRSTRISRASQGAHKRYSRPVRLEQIVSPCSSLMVLLLRRPRRGHGQLHLYPRQRWPQRGSKASQ